MEKRMMGKMPINGKTSGFSRRDLLKAIGVGAAGMTLASRWSMHRAAAQSAGNAPFAFYSTQVGDITLSIIQEARVSLPANFYGGNISPTAAEELLAANNQPAGEGGVLTTTVNIALLQTGDRLALLDTGWGDFPFPGVSESGLISTLRRLGITPDQITDLVISHFHPDHVGGISNNAGEAIFPNAVVHMTDVEYNFISDPPAPIADLAGAAMGRIAPAMAADRFATYTVDAEVLPGVTAMHAPGHTPGQVAFRISSGDQQLIASSDVANHPLLALANPNWHFGFDADPETAVTTRRALFGMLADDGLPVFAYHFPFPGIGYITRQGDGFAYDAGSY
jgi:glyoxylase-like metal-dependent hydrolase (beta-lactamase superfamily II)